MRCEATAGRPPSGKLRRISAQRSRRSRQRSSPLSSRSRKRSSTRYPHAHQARSPSRTLPRTTGEAFDPLGPATVAADVTIGFVLQHDRAARMVAQNAIDPTLPGLGEVIDRLTKATFDAVTTSPYEAEVRRATERVLIERLTWLATAAPNGQARAVASMKLQRLGSRLKTTTTQARGGRRAIQPARGQHHAVSRTAR